MQEINIDLNPSLLDLNVLNTFDLDNLRSLRIAMNSSLECCANSLVCNFLEENSNLADIRDNSVGCSSVGEITEICALLPDDPGAMNNCDFTISTTSNSSSKFISVSPNPSDGLMQLSLGNASSFDYKIFDLNGQTIQASQNKFGTVALDLIDFPKGVYFLSVESEGEVYTEKLVRF